MTKPTNKFFRELDSVRFSESIEIPSEFNDFVQDEIWPKLEMLHGKYHTDRKRRLCTQIVHLLVETGLTCRVAADSRDDHDKAAYRRKPVWDALEKCGFCRSCKGSERSKKVTRYRATRDLLDLRQHWELRFLEELALKRNTEVLSPTKHALVVLYPGKCDWLTDKVIPEEDRHKPISIRERIEAMAQRSEADITKQDPQTVQAILDRLRGIEDSVEKINAENLKHSWRARRVIESVDGGKREMSFQPNVCLRQIHVGTVFRAARPYSWGPLSGQGLPKDQRQTIQIDGEPAAEIDSHCHAIRLVHHLSRIDERGDVYYPERVFRHLSNAIPHLGAKARNFVKLATNICLNTNSRRAAVSAIGYALQESADSTHLKEPERRGVKQAAQGNRRSDFKQLQLFEASNQRCPRHCVNLLIS